MSHRNINITIIEDLTPKCIDEANKILAEKMNEIRKNSVYWHDLALKHEYRGAFMGVYEDLDDLKIFDKRKILFVPEHEVYKDTIISTNTLKNFVKIYVRSKEFVIYISVLVKENSHIFHSPYAEAHLGRFSFIMS